MYKKQKINENSRRLMVIGSPLLIILANSVNAFFSGQRIGKWAFIPVILVEWCLFVFFIGKYGGWVSVRKWLSPSRFGFAWNLPVLVVGFIPLPIFLMHRDLLTHWSIWVPWIILALVNPWLEEFYWRGLLLDYTASWNKWVAILFSSILFAGNHAVYGINAQLFRGPQILIATLVMGLVWAATYRKTGTLKWAIFSHFLVDFLNLSAPSFLDLYSSGR